MISKLCFNFKKHLNTYQSIVALRHRERQKDILRFPGPTPVRRFSFWNRESNGVHLSYYLVEYVG